MAVRETVILKNSVMILSSKVKRRNAGASNRDQSIITDAVLKETLAVAPLAARLFMRENSTQSLKT